MKTYTFFMLFVCIFFSIFNAFTHENSLQCGTPTQDNKDNIAIIIEAIYHLLSQGYTLDKILEMVDGNYAQKSSLQELIELINTLLIKEYSKNDIVHIITLNEDANDFYAQASLKEKIKMSFYLIKIILVLCIVGIMSYIFFTKYRKNDTTFTNNVSENVAQQIINHAEHMPATTIMPTLQHISIPPHEEHAVKKPYVINRQPDQQAITTQQGHNDTTIERNEDTLLADKKYHIAPYAHKTITIYEHNHTLAQALQTQIEYAHTIGCTTTITPGQYDDHNHQNRGNLKFNELITHQIAYADSMGLVPSYQ